MKLKKVRVQNFRSIEDTGEFSIDDLTCLVGKNEAGKTAILQALQSVFPHGKSQTEFDVGLDYPRRFVTKYDERHPDGDAIVVWTQWELDEIAKKLLADEFGTSALTGDLFHVSKYYNQSGTTWSLPIDESKAVTNLIVQAQFTEEEKAEFKEPKRLLALSAALDAVSEPTEKHNALKARIAKYRDGNIIKHGIDLIHDLMPRFFYASHYDRMSGQVSVDDLVQKQRENSVDIGDEIFLSFLELAGTSLDDLKDTRRHEDLVAKYEAASNEITEQIFTYWTQNDALEVKLDPSQGRPEDPAPFNSGSVVRARVWNALHRASVPFSERSAGFVWFFSFLVQFAAIRKTAGNVIILLDEPGLNLHGKAQADLLRYIENELLPHHQVIYSTHSPFMVPADRFMSVRIVEDVVTINDKGKKDVMGTKVSEDVLVTDKDTLFPLQSALGYDLTQSLFVGKHTLLVEGPSDILYLQALSEALKRQKREGLDPRWTLCPSGGIGNIRPFVALFGSNALDIAVLADQTKSDAKKIEELRKSEILATGRVMTIANFIGKDEADIEDIFDPELFVEIVNKAYELPKAHRLTAKKLVEAEEGTIRQVKLVEAIFRLMPDSIPMYDHFSPSAWLVKNIDILSGDSEYVKVTLDRAESLFKAFNKLLAQ
ncbi:MAG: AAA family ATPase [Armatimonadetes bacterium]|nr:AAA family ATPase [Armatimonadota bacterium]